MKISIVTACYNASSTLQDTIKSVRMQTYSDWEHLLIDGASTDDSVSVAKQYSNHFSLMLSEPDKGIYDAMNKGISLATGDVIGTLNADDLYNDSSVLGRVAVAFEDPRIDAVYGDLVLVNQEDVSRTVRYWRSSPYSSGLFSRGWVPPHPTFFTRRTVYQKYGLFDLRYKLAADFELLARLLANHSISSLYLHHVLVRMRLGGVTNKSLRNIIYQNLEILRAMRANGISTPLLFPLYKLQARLVQFLQRPT